jgi:hypothetical protein
MPEFLNFREGRVDRRAIGSEAASSHRSNAIL